MNTKLDALIRAHENIRNMEFRLRDAAVSIGDALMESVWKDIKDELPDEPGYYLVSGGGKVWIAEMMLVGEIKGWANDARNPCVEAWMQLPDAYVRSGF